MKIFSEKIIREILLKYAMSLPEAYKTIGVPYGTDKEVIDKVYRELALRNHPDKGGDEEKMKLINDAKDVIDKNVSGNEISEDEFKKRKKEREERDEKLKKENEEKSKEIQNIFRDNKSKYQEYLEKTTGKKTELYVKKIIDSSVIDFEYKFKSDDGTEFTVELFTSSSYQNEEYSYGSNVYYQKRIHKMQAQRFNKADTKFFADPSNAFPASKLKKIFSQAETRALKRRDAEQILVKEFAAKRLDSGSWRINLEGEKYIIVYRSVMMRVPAWAINGLYEKFRRIAMPKKFNFYAETMDKVTETTIGNFQNFLDVIKDIKNDKYEWNFKQSSKVASEKIVDGKETIRMSPSLKSKANKILGKISTTTGNYYENIPLKDIIDKLDEIGIKVIDENGEEWSGMLAGRDSRADFDLAIKDEKDDRFKTVKNALLSLSWHKMESGRYEITTYVG